jgi:hypothetical protein
MPGLQRHEGELVIDHRASPGTKEVPEGNVLELPTYTCAHCERIVFINSVRTRSREVCRRCMRVICDPCHGTGLCEPYIKIAEDLANAAYHAGSFGLLLPRE